MSAGEGWRRGLEERKGGGGWGVLGEVEGKIGQIVTLSQNEEACRLLGVDGVLEGQLDVAFLNDPLQWLAFDIAAALRAADEETEEIASSDAPPLLATLVAEARLCRVLLGQVDEIDLGRRVRGYLPQ